MRILYKVANLAIDIGVGCFLLYFLLNLRAVETLLCAIFLELRERE